MKKPLLIAAVLAVVFYAGYDLSDNQSQEFLREKTNAECEEQWASKGGTFLLKDGPITGSSSKTPSDKGVVLRIRNCSFDWDKRMTVADTFTQEYVNSPCHTGYRYIPNDPTPEAYKAARCFQGDSVKRVVKTWSWKTN